MTSAATSLLARAHARVQQLALNDQPWPAAVHNIAATSSHSNPPSGQRPSPNSASKQTAAVRTTRAPAGAPTAARIWCASFCTAPCTRRYSPTTQCESLTGFNLPSVVHRPVHTVRQRPVHSQRQLATAVQPIAARTRAAACTTVAQVCHLFSSPPASAAPASGAHPCTAPCARRCASVVQLGSRTGFNLPSILHRSMHTLPQQPARLMTSHGQQVCKSLLASRGTGMRRRDNSPARAVRPSTPRSYAQPARHSAHRLA
jgi:hypothetical protein